MVRKFSRTKDRSRELRQEQLILDVTEQIFESMKRQGVTQRELADRLSKSKSYVSQLLNGSRNMTLRTLSDVCLALGVQPAIKVDMETSSGVATRRPARDRRTTIPEYHGRGAHG